MAKSSRPLSSVEYGESPISKDERKKVHELWVRWDLKGQRLSVELDDVATRRTFAAVFPFAALLSVSQEKGGRLLFSLTDRTAPELLEYPTKSPSSFTKSPPASAAASRASRLTIQFRDEAKAQQALKDLCEDVCFRALVASSPLMGFQLRSTPLGQGTYGSVYAATDPQGRHVAVKIVRKTPARVRESAEQRSERLAVIRREFENQSRLQHPGIVSVISLKEDAEHLYLVQELATGGEVFERLADLGDDPEGPPAFSEETTRCIMRHLLAAIGYLHASSIVHRDLKPENIMFATSEDRLSQSPCVKLIDFGISKLITAADPAKTLIGTPGYLAPEVLLGRPYTDACDVWSCGVVMYVLLANSLPFEPKPLTYANLVAARLDPEVLRRFSPACADLIARLLQTDVALRPSAADALNHPFFTTTNDIISTRST